MKEEIKPSNWNRYHLPYLTDYYLSLKHNICKQINATVSIILITLEYLQHQRLFLFQFYSLASNEMMIMANVVYTVTTTPQNVHPICS